jgi:nucleotide-binding universal stress UspA family protein
VDDGDERTELSRIEADLARTDPEFEQQFTRAQSLLPRRLPSPPAVAASALLLTGTGVLLAVGVITGDAIAVVFGAICALLAGWPLARSVSMRELSGRQAQRRQRLARGAAAVWPSVPPNRDVPLLPTAGSVVVACDGHPRTDAALQYAVAEARRRRCYLFVVVAFREAIDPDIDDFDVPSKEKRTQARREGEAALARVARDAPTHEVIAGAGPAIRIMTEVFADAALFVVSSRPHGRFGKGSMAADSRVPIVAIPPAWHP